MGIRTISSTPQRRDDKVQKETTAEADEGGIIEEENKYEKIEGAEDLWKPVPNLSDEENSKFLLQEIEDRFENKEYNKEAMEAMEDLEKTIQGWDIAIREVSKVPKKIPRTAFWMEDEEDEDLLHEGPEEDDNTAESDMMSMAHGKLEEYREQREYFRIAVWQMPLLTKLAKPFVPPTPEECLRFRYTTYMGEDHPAQSKVVLEFTPDDMPLDDAQKWKLRKLLGPRWNPETDVAKMSCEQFDHQAQNKRYLGDLVLKLIEKAKDPTDMFEDIPLDVRHHKFKVKPKFPKAWRLTDERRKLLEDMRKKALLLDQEKEAEGALIDGVERINDFHDGPKLEPVKIPERPRLPSSFPELNTKVRF